MPNNPSCLGARGPDIVRPQTHHLAVDREFVGIFLFICFLVRSLIRLEVQVAQSTAPDFCTRDPANPTCTCPLSRIMLERKKTKKHVFMI